NLAHDNTALVKVNQDLEQENRALQERNRALQEENQVLAGIKDGLNAQIVRLRQQVEELRSRSEAAERSLGLGPADPAAAREDIETASVRLRKSSASKPLAESPRSSPVPAHLKPLEAGPASLARIEIPAASSR